VATAIRGGREGYGFIFSCVDGPSGTGLSVFSQSLVVLRGAPGAEGLVAPGPVDGICGDIVGLSMLINNATVVTSGVGFDATNVQVIGGSLIQPAVPEPLVVVDGTDGPGAHKAIWLYGPAGATCLLAGSLLPEHSPPGQFDDDLWLGLSGAWVLVPLVTAGQALPVVLTYHVPSSLVGLEGLAIELQPFFPGVPSTIKPGKSVAANVAEIVFRF
jgi:hypothetical protein